MNQNLELLKSTWAKAQQDYHAKIWHIMSNHQWNQASHQSPRRKIFTVIIVYLLSQQLLNAGWITFTSLPIMPLVMCLQYLRETSLANPTRVHLEGQLIDDGMHFTGGHSSCLGLHGNSHLKYFWNFWKVILEMSFSACSRVGYMTSMRICFLEHLMSYNPSKKL